LLVEMAIAFITPPEPGSRNREPGRL